MTSDRRIFVFITAFFFSVCGCQHTPTDLGTNKGPRSLVYVLNGGQLFIINDDGTNKRLLTGGVGAKWSPKGDKIAFFGSEHDPGFFVCTIRPDGSEFRQLTLAAPEDDLLTVSLDWSPDGERLVFFTTKHHSTGFAVISAEGTDERMLTGEGFWEGADWSPDGTKIALFGTETGSKQTFIINPDSTRKYEIAWNTTYAHWSPDGKRLATTIGTWDDQLQKWLRDVYVISADGSNLQRLTYDGNKSLDDWSLVGDKMLYLFQPEGMVNPLAYGLGVMSANGLQEKVLVQVDENHGIVLGSFSPDGKKIAYVKNSFTTDEEPSALWVMDADGSNQRKLDGHSVPRLIFYDWSPK